MTDYSNTSTELSRRQRLGPWGVTLLLMLAGCQPAPDVREPAQYVGHFQSGCFAHQWVRVGSPDGPPIMVRADFSVAVAGDRALQLVLTQRLFEPDDLSCEGVVRGTEVSDVRMTIDAKPTEVRYQNQTLPAARIEVHYAPPREGGSAVAQRDALFYPPGYFSNHRVRRYLLLMIGDGMYFGNEEREKDAEGYPIHLEDEPGAIRD